MAHKTWKALLTDIWWNAVNANVNSKVLYICAGLCPPFMFWFWSVFELGTGIIPVPTNEEKVGDIVLHSIRNKSCLSNSFKEITKVALCRKYDIGQMASYILGLLLKVMPLALTQTERDVAEHFTKITLQSSLLQFALCFFRGKPSSKLDP